MVVNLLNNAPEAAARASGGEVVCRIHAVQGFCPSPATIPTMES